MFWEFTLEISEEVAGWSRTVQHIWEVIENIRRLSERNSEITFGSMDWEDHRDQEDEEEHKHEHEVKYQDSTFKTGPKYT